jgi:hypothetical protein
MDTSFTNARESLADARRPQVDWSALTHPDRVRFLELEGYLLWPQVLDAELLQRLHQETAKLETRAVDYSASQRTAIDLEYRTDLPAIVRLIAHPPVIRFLRELFGDEVICTSYHYGVSRPGHPGIVIHADAQPYGSQALSTQASSPVLMRVLYYLDELTQECSPFKVVPRSHLSLHSDANPSQRYLAHPDEVMVTCPAGSAAIINQKVFHGNYPNHSNADRRMLAIAYRPAWAGPLLDVEDRDRQRLAELPQEVQPLLASLNTRHIEHGQGNRPEGMRRVAAGLSPARWEDSQERHRG